MKHTHRPGSIQKKILAITLSCLLGMCVIISSVSYYIFRNYLQHSLIQSTETSLQLLSDRINNSMDDIYQMTFFCQTNTNIATYIARNPNPGSILSVSTYDRIFEEHSNNPSKNYMIRLAVITNDHFLQVVSAAYSSTADLSAEVPGLPFFETLLNDRDYNFSSGFIKDPFCRSGKNVLPVIRPITYQFSAIQGGFLFMEISSDLFTDALERYTVAEDSFMYLTISGHSYRYSEDGLTEIVPSYHTRQDLSDTSMIDNIQIQEIEDSSGINRLVVTAPLNMPDCYVSQSISHSELRNQQLLLFCLLAGTLESYVCCYGEMTSNQADSLPMERQLSLFATSMQMLKELACKYRPCFCLSLDTRHFALIFCYEQGDETSYATGLKDILGNIRETLYHYYNVSFCCGIGSLVENPLSVCDSYQYSRQACQSADPDTPVIYFEDCARRPEHNSFNISLFKSDLTRAFEEYDARLLKQILDSLCELFLAHPNHYVQALDGACNILYLSLSLLQDGEKIISDFYRDTPDGYRSIYKQTSVEQIANWLTCFGAHLCQLFERHHKDYKNHIVTNVKKYINQHVMERLTLNEVAAVFGISPNYLSQLFGKYNEVGFSEYINSCKIAEARRLLDEGTMKVYEVAEMLGFESSFYFSKVFKKVEGISPSDYQNKLC